MTFATDFKKLLEEVDSDFNPPLSSSLNLHDYAQKIYHNASIFSLHEEGKLVAALAVYSNDPNREIAFCTMLAVSKQHRNYGSGTNLVRTTVDFLKKKSFKVFRLEIYKNNPKAIAFYERLNFAAFSETENTVFVELKLS